MKKLAQLVCCSLLTHLSVSANEASIDFGSDVVNIDFVSENVIQDTSIGFGGLFADDDISLVNVSMMVKGDLGDDSNWNVGLGGNLYLAKVDDEYVQGFGLGTEIAYQFSRFPKLSAKTSLYYVPSVAISDDLDHMVDFTAKLSYQLLNRADVFIGYRNVELDADHGSIELDEGFHAGMTFTF